METAGGPRLERLRSRAMRHIDCVWATPVGWLTMVAKMAAAAEGVASWW